MAKRPSVQPLPSLDNTCSKRLQLFSGSRDTTQDGCLTTPSLESLLVYCSFLNHCHTQRLPRFQGSMALCQVGYRTFCTLSWALQKVHTTPTLRNAVY